MVDSPEDWDPFTTLLSCHASIGRRIVSLTTGCWPDVAQEEIGVEDSTIGDPEAP